MDLTITFPGGLRVNADFGDYTVKTDQPAHSGGEGSAPTPFATFQASLGACAGVYVLGFCRQRNIPTQGITLTQHTEADPETGRVVRIDMDIHVPPGFPARYHDALVRAADQCAVKKLIDHPPSFVVRTVVDA